MLKKIVNIFYEYYHYYITDMKYFKAKYYNLLENNKELLSNFEALQKSSHYLFIKNEFLEEKTSFHDEEKIKSENINIDLTYKIDILTYENKGLQNLNEEYCEKIKRYDKLFSERSKKTIKHCAKKLNTKKNDNISLSGLNNPNFGNGPIRFHNNGKYYHGVCKNDDYSWKTEKHNQCFFEYKEGHKIAGPGRHPDKWDTYNADLFCTNCVIDEELSKNRRVMKIYRCNGHK
jgi:hypothetical protein